MIGLGYVGLPLASLCAKQGYETVGLENNISILNQLLAGKCHIKDEVVEDLLSDALASGNFSPTSDLSNLSDCDTYLICVPTPIDENNNPDLKPLENAVRAISPFINKGDLVIVESTVFPGTCEDIVLPLIQQVSGLVGLDDFYLAHCPERVNPGDLFWNSSNIPRVVGALSKRGTEIAADFYASILGGPVYDVREIKSSLSPKFTRTAEGELKVAQVALGSVTKMHSIRDAEAVKAMENTVRDVNIAFVNELARISDVLDLDVVDIIDGMVTKPFGKGPFYPGVGVGGHCIAVDPEWLKAAANKAGYMPEIINLARTTNNDMPAYTISVLQDLLNECGLPIKGTEIAVFGVAYKRNVDDPRESPFYAVRDLLLKKGAKLNVFDNWYLAENTVSSVQEAVQKSSAIVIVTEHSDLIEQLKLINISASGIKVIVDGRNCLSQEIVRDWGVLYRGIGRRSAENSKSD